MDAYIRFRIEIVGSSIPSSGNANVRGRVLHAVDLNHVWSDKLGPARDALDL